MILNQIALLLMVLLQVTFIRGSEGATSTAVRAPEETSDTCQTSMGPGDNEIMVKPCMLPFKYNDKTMDMCITLDTITIAGSICPIENPNGTWFEEDKWGYCLLKPVGNCDATRVQKEKPSLSTKCCELKGVPEDCLYACQEQSNVMSRNDVPCMDHETEIANCLEDPNPGFKGNLTACCDYYNVKEEAEDCHNLLCTSECPSSPNVDPKTLPWAFLELHPKKECNKYVKEIKKCCGYHEKNQQE